MSFARASVFLGKTLKCFVQKSLICISSHSFLTTKKAFGIIYSNNVILGSWNSGCCGLPRNSVSTPGNAKALRLDLALTQPLIQWVSTSLLPGTERQGHEANHSLPSSPEVKNGNSYRPTSPIPEGPLTFTWRNSFLQIFLRISLHSFLK
jgi:hypothetical protein